MPELKVGDEKKEVPFGATDISAEMAVTMGLDPRPYLSEQQIESQLSISKMTREEWDAEWDRRLNCVPF